MQDSKFFALIIGTEILNRRRTDKHFEFVTKELLKRGHKLAGCFIIEDNPTLIVKTIEFISTQDDSILFSFGGIGSTPDDYTREAASLALRDGKIPAHKEAVEIISSNVDTSVHPHALNMAKLPVGSKLLKNHVNNMPAFSLDDRYFFMPGFPEMSHPMVTDIMDEYFQDKAIPFSYTLTALCKESHLIEIMQKLPENVELSSLPMRYNDGYRTTIHVSSKDVQSAKHAFGLFIDKLDADGIYYSLDDQ